MASPAHRDDHATSMFAALGLSATKRRQIPSDPAWNGRPPRPAVSPDQWTASAAPSKPAGLELHYDLFFLWLRALWPCARPKSCAGGLQELQAR